jgi:predicted LPLAT superfamily acyltransferase
MRRGVSHWAQVGEAGAMAGLRLMLLIHRRLGRWPFRLVMVPVMLYFYLRRAAARRASLEYLERLAGRVGPAARHRRSFGHFLAFGDCLLDKVLAWCGRLALDRLTIQGLEAVEAGLGSGRGAVLLVSHLGNLELCRAVARRTPHIRMTVLAHTRHTPRFNELLARLNPDSQADVVQVTDVTAATGVRLADRIATGGLVAIAADRVPVTGRPRLVTVPFAGAPAPFPAGPFLLAAQLDCPVYLLFCLRLAEGYEIVFEPFAAPLRLPADGREAGLRDAVGRFAARLEHHCRRAPLQWFNFYPFWSAGDGPLAGGRGRTSTDRGGFLARSSA